jgi:hypothetical protein
MLRTELGLSRSAAVCEAVQVRTLAWERMATRRQQALFRDLWRQAEEWAPLDELLSAAAAQADDRAFR